MNIHPYALFLIGFLLLSRQAQSLLSKQDQRSVSYLSKASPNKSCEIGKDSLIGESIRMKSKTLIIIIDAYPSASLYEEITGKKSNLHRILKEKSTAKGESFSRYPYTFFSLAYLLGGIENPSSKCHYPSFGRIESPVKQLTSNPYVQADSKECSVIQADYMLKPILIRAIQNLNRNWMCSLISPRYTNELIKEIKVNELHALTETKTSIIHDLGYHDIETETIDKECQINKKSNKNIVMQLELADNCYATSIQNVLDFLNHENFYSRIVIMSDHGPGQRLRLKVTRPLEEIKTLKRESLEDKVFYQYFWYAIEKNNQKTGGIEKIMAPSKEATRFKMINSEKAKWLNTSSSN